MSENAIDKGRRRLLTTAATVVGGVGGIATAIPFVSTLTPSAKARAIGAPVELEIGDLQPGDLKIEKWQGKPVWVLRRKPAELEALDSLTEELRDPNSEKHQQPEYAKNEYRSVKPEYLIVLGLCTHLGCSPKLVRKDEAAAHGLPDDWQGGFFCPCHGSRFDLAGRVYKGVPAPTNLVVPPHQYLSDSKVLVGDDSGVT